MIKVPFELLSDIINEEIDIVVDGIKYWYIKEDTHEQFKDIITKTIIFERSYEGGSGYYGLDVILTDYGNDLDEDYNECELYPVRMHEDIIQTFIRR